MNDIRVLGSNNGTSFSRRDENPSQGNIKKSKRTVKPRQNNRALSFNTQHEEKLNKDRVYSQLNPNANSRSKRGLTTFHPGAHQLPLPPGRADISPEGRNDHESSNIFSEKNVLKYTESPNVIINLPEGFNSTSLNLPNHWTLIGKSGFDGKLKQTNDDKLHSDLFKPVDIPLSSDEKPYFLVAKPNPNNLDRGGFDIIKFT
ncbi:hypothetical protein CS022_10285 [Veronia nyctiphanis]|uniref:Uncharacterized protein n=1 Tax=Veronia nyctiphanis TaxID=1278244 RepID=A0A4Q0YT68_9GAMM|nr:hypothetical protein [Veronia nyctiphanis]RXJ73354.1 hypothetical protein CS022_10285 [Veronia nyctiphanis]